MVAFVMMSSEFCRWHLKPNININKYYYRHYQNFIITCQNTTVFGHYNYTCQTVLLGIPTWEVEEFVEIVLSARMPLLMATSANFHCKRLKNVRLLLLPRWYGGCDEGRDLAVVAARVKSYLKLQTGSFPVHFSKPEIRSTVYCTSGLSS